VGAEEPGFQEFYAAQYGRLRHLGYWLTGDWGQAEELAQEALVRTWWRWPVVRRLDRPGDYARRVLVNRHRSLRRRALVEARYAARARTEEAQPFDGHEDAAVLAAALRRLSPRQRAVIVLRYQEDLSQAEVARLLGYLGQRGQVDHQPRPGPAAQPARPVRRGADAQHQTPPQRGGTMNVEERLKEAYERTRSSGPAQAGAYDRFLRRRARSVRTVAAVAVLVLALAGLAPRLLAGPDRGVVRPPRPVPPKPVPAAPRAPRLIAHLNADGPGGRAVALSADGRTLAVVGNHRISLWDLERRTRTVMASPETPNGREVIAFAPDGRTLAAAAGDRVVLWDLASRTRRASLPMGTFNVANRLAFSPDGRVLAAGDNGGELVVWDVARRSRLAVLSSGIGRIADLAFRADGRYVVVGGTDRSHAGSSAAVIDIAQGRRLPGQGVRVGTTLEAYTTVAFRPDGTALTAMGDDKGKGIPIFDVTHGPNLAHLATIFVRGLGALLGRDGSLLAVGSLNGEVVLWEVGRRGLARRVGPLPGFHVRVVRPGLDFFLSPRIGTFLDGRLAISDGAGSIFVWSTAKP
jgi:RNA polymerase sigma factor (sigma-70 family)